MLFVLVQYIKVLSKRFLNGLQYLYKCDILKAVIMPLGKKEC